MYRISQFSKISGLTVKAYLENKQKWRVINNV